MHGLAQQMSEPGNYGRAIMLMHEGKSRINGLLQGDSIVGAMDDFNMLADHDFYDNSVLAKESLITVENPHLTGILLMHIDEVIARKCVSSLVCVL